MRRGSWAADPTTVMKASVDGVIKSAELKELGVAAGTIVRRCSPGGTWQRILPGVVLLHNGNPTVRQRNLAALRYAGPESMLSGHASLGVQGCARSTSMRDVHVLIPHRCRRLSTSFVTVERTTRLPTPLEKAGTRVAPIDRSLLDAARNASSLDSCRTTLIDAIQRGVISPEELAIELASGSSRGSALPRSVLTELSDNAHSVAELEAQKFYATTGLPPMRFNIDIVDEHGTFIATPDGWIDGVALAWEINSLRHHLSVKDHEATVVRRARMQRHGVIVVEHLPKQIRNDKSTVFRDLHENYQLALSRPRPPVFWRPSTDRR